MSEEIQNMIDSIAIGKSVCFITKDERNHFRTINCKVLDDNDLDLVSDIPNSKYVVHIIVGDNQNEVLAKTQKWFSENTGQQVDENEVGRFHKKQSVYQENAPGANSFVRDAEGNIIKLVPKG